MEPFSAALSSGDKNAQNAIKTQQQHNELVIKRMNMIICTVTARCYRSTMEHVTNYPASSILMSILCMLAPLSCPGYSSHLQYSLLLYE